MGKYQRKSNRGSYSKEKLKEAVQEVVSGRMSGYKAAKIYEIPRMTIMDHVNNRRNKSTTLGRNTALSAENEFRLATNLHFMEKYGFGLSRKEVLQLVGDFINKNNIISPFKNGIPGKDWFLAFKERHGLSIKKPQAVEYARKKAVDPFIIYPYFELLDNTINELNLKYKPSSIWNVDETSFSKDPTKTKVVGAKGHASTRVISTAGRDNTTVLLGANASGEKTPPLIVYKGKNVWDTWTSAEAYPGTSYAATKNGWMETEVFESFFKKTFLPAVRDKGPVLLIYDGHSTHVGLNIIEEARKENVTILKLPPHTSHVLQPLDIAVMKPFKDRWDALLVQWQRLNVGNVMPKSEFARLIGQVWAEIDSQVLRNGFRKAGIYPVNREEIKEIQFDSLKLRHWREYETTRDNTEKDIVIERNPESLLTLTLNFFKDNELSLPIVEEETKDRYMQIENRTRDTKITFEELLLQKLKRGDSSPNPRRRKIAPGAEVITHDDVLEKKREEQRKKEKLPDKNLTKGQNIKIQSSNDVVYLSKLSKTDCHLLPFIAKDKSELPLCFNKQKPLSPKIKIISNILVKSTNKTKDITRNQKQNTFSKNLALSDKENNCLNKVGKPKKAKLLTETVKDVFGTKALYDPKPSGSGLCKSISKRQSTSTTSVSGSISYYSDTESDLMDLMSNHDEDEGNQVLTSYQTGDDVIVRYHTRQKWTYYVGRIEHINSITNEGPLYSIRFYKTIKKPTLAFKITKKIDRDDVPALSIVKKVDLMQNLETLNYFFVDYENSIYF